MEVTIQEVESAITDILGPGGEFMLVVEDGRVAGYLVHPAISGLTVPKRLKRLRSALNRRFQDRANQIGMLLLYSPEEYEEMSS